MGNSCVHGKTSEDGILYAVSRSFWPSRSPDMTAISGNDKSVDCSKDQSHVDPPKVVKLEDEELNRSPPLKFNPVVVVKEESKVSKDESHVNPPKLVKMEDEEFKVVDEVEHVIMTVKENPKPVAKKPPRNIKRKMSVGLEVESVLRTRTGHLKEHFNLGKKIGRGQFGTTFLCIERKTGKKYACKSIAKRKLLEEDDLEDVRREIEIMHHLSGHQNVVSIQGAYEDAVAVHVVMELCGGGELFDRILKRGHYSEKKAAELTRTIAGVIETCHSLGVMHRDIKPENFLFVNNDEDSPMKIIDFGLSVFFKPGETFCDVVGSPYYVAPEVLRKRYGPEADVWSVGVIIYILLCGTPPFWAETEQEIFEEVLRGDIDFTSDPWPNISESAKDLVKKMLVRDPKKRITAHQVLCHPWVQVQGVAPDKPLDSAVLSRMTQFSAMHKLKKMAIRVIAESLSEEEIAGLREMFKTIDTDNSGYITFEELKDGLTKYGANLDESQINDLMRAADVNDNGAIDYGEFIAATLNVNKIDKDDHLVKAFSYFDRDGSGYITKDELQTACLEFGIQDFHLEEMIQEADQNNDGRIDYNEFVAMMHKGDRDLSKKKFKKDFGVEFRESIQVC